MDRPGAPRGPLEAIKMLFWYENNKTSTANHRAESEAVHKSCMKNKLLLRHHPLLLLAISLRAPDKVALSGFDTIWFCYTSILSTRRCYFYQFTFENDFSSHPLHLIFSFFLLRRHHHRWDLQFCSKTKMKTLLERNLQKWSFPLSRCFILEAKMKTFLVRFRIRLRHDPALFSPPDSSTIAFKTRLAFGLVALLLTCTRRIFLFIFSLLPVSWR